MQNQSHVTVVEALMRVLHEFLLYKAKEAGSIETDQTGETPGLPVPVSMFYLNAESNDVGAGPNMRTVENSSVAADEVAAANQQRRDTSMPSSSMPTSHQVNASTFVEEKRGSNPNVNEIIVKIEMKKF